MTRSAADTVTEQEVIRVATVFTLLGVDLIDQVKVA